MLEKMREIDEARKAQKEQQALLESEEQARKIKQEREDEQFVSEVIKKLDPQSLLEKINREVLQGRGGISVPGKTKCIDGETGKQIFVFDLNWDSGRVESPGSGYTDFGESISIIVGASICREITYKGPYRTIHQYKGVKVKGGDKPVANFELNRVEDIKSLSPEIEKALVKAFESSHWSNFRSTEIG
ncbi:MAG: hypothetical protein MUP45_04845 [Candidatus Marinimicrobia bacterium]|nr:hypothetical protein [Candidatus Neomarinimicrobiota bacterium]